jgi:glyoxylate utilization-related uncharacterized protein
MTKKASSKTAVQTFATSGTLKNQGNSKASEANVITEIIETHDEIKDSEDMKKFLMKIRDKVSEGVSSPIYTLTALNFAFTIPGAHVFFNNENKELARELWLRLKNQGFQLRNPPLLFGDAG